MRSRPGSRLLALVLVLVAAPAARGARLLTAAPGRPVTGLPSVSVVHPLALDAAGLAALRGERAMRIDAFSLGQREVALDLERIEPFAGTRVEVVDDGGAHPLALPDRAYFGGTVVGDPESRVLVVAGADSVHGWVAADQTIYLFGPDAAGGYQVYDLRDADPAVQAAPTGFCGTGAHPELTTAPAAFAAGAFAPAPPSAGAPAPVLAVEMAIETDQELRAKFASNEATLGYLADLAAAANVIYQRDVGVRIVLSYVRIWDTTDPWTKSDPYDQLVQLGGYWQNPANDMQAIAGPYDLVHFVSGRSVVGGVAWITGVCDPEYQFAVSQVYGSVNVVDPALTWDVVVFTHETGHALGTQHTHCYTPPIDMCYSGEPSNEPYTCYVGPESLPPGGGTLMSYCHQLAPGMPNINLNFHTRVQSTIRGTVEAKVCITEASTCGDGVVEGGEECDDANTISGDGCSSDCLVETTCGDGVREGREECDDGNTTAGDGCSAICLHEECGNRIVDPGEDCDDGNDVAGDGCTPDCAREPRCGDGFLDPGEGCDDGNTEDGDGCSRACAAEVCVVESTHQTLWAPATAKIVHANSGDRLTIRGRFGIPATPGGLAAQDVRLVISSSGGADLVDLTLPGDGPWATKQNRRRYRDRAGSQNGIRRVHMKVSQTGDITEIDLKLAGKGGKYPVTPADLPIGLSVVIGGDAGGEAGQCGHYVFAPGACVSKRGGKRIVCR